MSEQCNRSGMCCTMFWLTLSPEELKLKAEAYIAYMQTNPEDMIQAQERTDEIYRMVGDRLIGKRKDDSGAHLYGPCKNLGYAEEKGKRVPTCMIQNNKPNMCSGYPRYPKSNEFLNTRENPSEYKGCGFNKDPKYGLTLKQIQAKVNK